ncbi:MAG: F0F1 ATP synthase subunit A [Candidatus Binatia bacterium]
MEHPFTWHSLLPMSWQALFPEHIFFSLVVMGVVVALAFRARKALAGSKDPVVPDEALSVRNIIEVVTGLIVDLSDTIIGTKGRKYVPLFGSFFIFILAANLTGLVPGFSPPTNNINVTLGLGLVSFFAYNYFGIKEHGSGYVKQFMGPVVFLAPLFIILELISHLVRPVSLALRLFGNMFGDHLVVEIFTDLTKVIIPVPFYLLGALVSVIQAAVFTVLSVIYVAMAVSHEH